MTTYLLDANVAIALVTAGHEHHERASRWASSRESFALCPIVEGALVRFVMRLGGLPGDAGRLLAELRHTAGVEFWPDDVSYLDVDLASLQGHRQATDAYLAALAASRPGARLATLDRALAARWPAAAELIPESVQ